MRKKHDENDSFTLFESIKQKHNYYDKKEENDVF